jgi:hypothetical protein
LDADGDGYLLSEDCDDTDILAYDDNGASEACPALSCEDILDRGYSTGDGTYWIDPSGLQTVEVYCDMTTDTGGWSILVEELGFPTTNVSSAAEYQAFCDGLGMTLAGRGTEDAASWLAQKRMLWNTGHPIRSSLGWPSGYWVSASQGGVLAMPFFKNANVVETIFNGTTATLPTNLRDDACDVASDELCGYWFSDGWSDSDLTVYPDPEDWSPSNNHAQTYLSCMFR